MSNPLMFSLNFLSYIYLPAISYHILAQSQLISLWSMLKPAGMFRVFYLASFRQSSWGAHRVGYLCRSKKKLCLSREILLFLTTIFFFVLGAFHVISYAWHWCEKTLIVLYESTMSSLNQYFKILFLDCKRFLQGASLVYVPFVIPCRNEARVI